MAVVHCTASIAINSAYTLQAMVIHFPSVLFHIYFIVLFTVLMASIPYTVPPLTSHGECAYVENNPIIASNSRTRKNSYYPDTEITQHHMADFLLDNQFITVGLLVLENKINCTMISSHINHIYIMLMYTRPFRDETLTAIFI